MTRSLVALVPPGLAFLLLLAGGVAHFAGEDTLSTFIWYVGLVLIGLPLAWRTLRRALAGRFDTDLVAMLAILAALALQQPLAGLIVVLMQTGGEALERHAEGRASRALQDLERLAPRVAHRVRASVVEDVAVDRIDVGDLLLIRPGELIPCDGMAESGRSHVDTSPITGEPVPVTVIPGARVSSGGHNLESPFEMRVTAPAQASQYAQIVQLVRSAQASKAPLQRLADRYATWFTPFTLLVCLLTYLYWHDPLRVLAVLVVATPCPLILATPVAIVGGISRAAKRGILFRHGTALEQLAHVDVAVFDKTGTLTIGRPEVARVIVAPGFLEAEVLTLAAAVEHGSSHLLARTLVEAAQQRGIALRPAQRVVEEPGMGITGEVDGHEVTVGARGWVSARHPAAAADLPVPDPSAPPGGLRACIVVDGRGAGVVEYADRLRPHLGELFDGLRRQGIRRTMLLSGDSQANAAHVAASVGVDEVHGDLTPAAKTAIVAALMKRGHRVLMLGDGTNDAPALSTATVGIALASGGGGIAAEAADAVVLADDPTRIVEAISLSRSTLRIARQSIWIGLGLSMIGMMLGAFGLLVPTMGAMAQEGIDVAVILNALRAARSAPQALLPPFHPPGLPKEPLSPPSPTL